MTQLVWDQVGSRTYESGLDRGVLYLSDGRAVPWNGLTAILEKRNVDISPTYYDGRKIQDRVVLGDFEATLKAVTYPDEFVEVEGLGEIRYGVYAADQGPQVFDLCYRTLIGNDLEGEQAGYKLHIIYNITAIPNGRAHATISANPSVVEFEWDISAVPDDTPGFRPTAHIILDSREMDPWLLEDIEEMLYGSEFTQPELMPLSELVTFMDEWYRWKVTDNGDGTYTLTSARDEQLVFSGTNLEIFQALGIYVIDHGDGTFTIQDTYDINEVPQIRITDNGDGTWTAETDTPGLISVDVEGYFNILNANATYVSPDEYELSDTIA